MRCSVLRAAGREHVRQMLEAPLPRIATVFIHDPILCRVFGLNVRFTRSAVRCNIMRCNTRCMRDVLGALRKEGQQSRYYSRTSNSLHTLSLSLPLLTGAVQSRQVLRGNVLGEKQKARPKATVKG